MNEREELTGRVQSDLYDVALVLDDAPSRFHDAALALHALRSRYSDNELRAIDLLYSKPSTLLCLLYFDPKQVRADFVDSLAPKARAGGFRFLNLTHLTMSERVRFYGDTLRRFPDRLVAVGDLEIAVEQLRRRVASSTPEVVGQHELRLEASLLVDGERQDAVATSISNTGLYLECDTPIPTGRPLEIELRTRLAHIHVRGRAVYGLDAGAAEKQGRPAGLGAAFELAPSDVNALESFLIAASRGKSWPEKSGRLFERFPIRLRVNYALNGEERREHTVDLSRGGLFIESFEPPPVGTELDLEVFALGSNNKVELRGLVVRVISIDDAATRHLPPGAGVEFIGEPANTAEKVRQLLAYVPAERRRRAMLVDDDRFFRQVISHSLSLAGYEVLHAGSGDEAFGQLVEELLHLDVLILDLYMPGMTGEELVTRLRRLADKLGFAIVVYTGATMRPDLEARLRDIGADAVIPKNVSPELVVEKLEKLVQEKRARR